MFVDLGRWRDISSLTCMGNNSHSIPFNFYLNRWHCPPRHPSQDNCWKLGQTPSPRSKNAKNIQKHGSRFKMCQDISPCLNLSSSALVYIAKGPPPSLPGPRASPTFARHGSAFGAHFVGEAEGDWASTVVNIKIGVDPSLHWFRHA